MSTDATTFTILPYLRQGDIDYASLDFNPDDKDLPPDHTEQRREYPCRPTACVGTQTNHVTATRLPAHPTARGESPTCRPSEMGRRPLR